MTGLTLQIYRKSCFFLTLRRLASLGCLFWQLGHAAEIDPDFVIDSFEDGANVNQPRPFKRSAVLAVVVLESAVKSLAGESTPDDCSRFVVNAKQVKQYFARAHPVSQRAYSEELDWSPCVANGTLKLADGRSAIWGVQQYGLGWLYIDHRRTYFHCKNCSLVNLKVTIHPQ